VEQIQFRRREVKAVDILSAARTLPTTHVTTCTFVKHRWLPAEQFLMWAQRGLNDNDSYGFSNAVIYAKRTASRMIDGLIVSNHLVPFQKRRGTYPEKIKALREIGICMPDIVHRLIIDPRNQLEHHYTDTDQQEARHAVELAELLLNATRIELERYPIIALGWNILFSAQCRAKKGGGYEEHVSFNGFGDGPMLFMDVFDEPNEVKIVHPGDGEVCFVPLSHFTQQESLDLARKLRENYQQANRGSSGYGETFLREIKRQAGF
jgi:hypothetical protein